MGRWEPDAQGRLERAALDLFAERGYERTTTAQIAERAGLTERTFFRHYTDKREVLFAGTHVLEDAVVAAAAAAPEGAAPLAVVATGLMAAGPVLAGRGALARQRQRVIAATAELRERELVKLAALAAALVPVLRRRGAGEEAAVLASEVGVTVFKVAFERWAEQPEGPGAQGFEPVLGRALAQLHGLAAAHDPAAASGARPG